MQDPILEMIREMKTDIREMDKKIDELLSIKWKLAGSAIAVCAVISFLFELGKLALIK